MIKNLKKLIQRRLKDLVSMEFKKLMQKKSCCNIENFGKQINNYCDVDYTSYFFNKILLVDTIKKYNSEFLIRQIKEWGLNQY